LLGAYKREGGGELLSIGGISWEKEKETHFMLGKDRSGWRNPAGKMRKRGPTGKDLFEVRVDVEPRQKQPGIACRGTGKNTMLLVLNGGKERR